MKTVKDKYVVVGADGAGFPLKEYIKAHLEAKGWHVEDVGTVAGGPQLMFHRVGFLVGSKIAEGEYERGLIFCGTAMGIHIAANKCPGVQAAVVESVPAAKRARVANNCNILGMGAMYVAPAMGVEMAEAFLNTDFAEDWGEDSMAAKYHKLAFDEINAFDYDKFKASGFDLDAIKLADPPEMAAPANAERPKFLTYEPIYK